MKKKILIGLLVIVIVAQAIQPTKNLGDVSGEHDIVKTIGMPDSVLIVLKRSCYDCHSNTTRYPWYHHITPINWWMAGHVNEGKAELNFSVFGQYPRSKQLDLLEEMAGTVKKNAMPLKSYLLTHGEARLSAADKKSLVDWTTAASRQLRENH